MRVRIIAVAVIIAMTTLAIPVRGETDFTQNEVEVYMNNEQVLFTEETGLPFIDGASRTQMPFRIILENYGATVEWRQETSEAVAIKDGIEVIVPIGERFIFRNSEKIMIDTESIIINGRTYLPLRAVMEAFGCEIGWNGELRRVEIDCEPTMPEISRLPELYDLRTFGKVSSIRNQHDIGACWAFATLGAIESALLPDQLYDFSEDHMSITHGYNLTQDEGGDFQISLAYLARWSGPIYEIEDPYGDGITNEGAVAAIHVQEALILPEKDFKAIKRAVMAYGGVQTSIHIRDIQSQELGEAYNAETNAFYYDGDAKPNHDVVIVGWDDNFLASNFSNVPSRDGAFICRNSYGDYFGDAGYFYVSYEDVLVGEESIVYSRIEGNNNYDKIYQADWLGWVGRIGYGKDTAYFSNVYTAPVKEIVEAVSFYSTDRDTTYEVYIVPQFASTEDYSNMEFVTRGQLDYAGYYTIDFEQGFEVEGDYAVVVKVTTPESLFPVAAEFYKDVEWLEDVDLTDGRGYMSYDGQLWENTESILESNVALKAFTNIVEVEEVQSDTAQGN